jgi:hypothetical protein
MAKSKFLREGKKPFVLSQQVTRERLRKSQAVPVNRSFNNPDLNAILDAVRAVKNLTTSAKESVPLSVLRKLGGL